MSFLENYHSNWIDLLRFNEYPFRAKLIPSKVLKDLDRYKNNPEGLANYVKKWRTKIVWLKHNSKRPNKFYVGGEYDPDSRQSTVFIHIDNFKYFKFTDKTWNHFKFTFIQTLMHELIHCSQFVNRGDAWSDYVLPYKKVGKDKVDKERRYYSEFDEIQAYAHCVYLDFKTYKPRIEISVLLKRCKKYKDSRTLHQFLKAFNYDFTHNFAPKKLIQHVSKWERKYSKYA